MEIPELIARKLFVKRIVEDNETFLDAYEYTILKTLLGTLKEV